MKSFKEFLGVFEENKRALVLSANLSAMKTSLRQSMMDNNMRSFPFGIGDVPDFYAFYRQVKIDNPSLQDSELINFFMPKDVAAEEVLPRDFFRSFCLNLTLNFAAIYSREPECSEDFRKFMQQLSQALKTSKAETPKQYTVEELKILTASRYTAGGFSPLFNQRRAEEGMTRIEEVPSLGMGV